MSKFCSNCGKEIQDGDIYCNNCGMKIETESEVADNNVIVPNENLNGNYNPNLKKDSQATASLVCGIVGLFLAGIILGIIAIVEANQSKAKTNNVFSSKAKAGFILGIIDIIGAIIYLISNN